LQFILASSSRFPATFSRTGIGAPVLAEAQNKPVTPIKHVIVITGENRTFDHGYGTFKPKHGQTRRELFSPRIVNADGTPGINYEL
jgi:phospholipase C